MSNSPYTQTILDFRKARDERVKTNPQNWLALIGLFRLDEGENHFGTEPTNKIVLPEFTQKHCGSFHKKAGDISVQPLPDSNLTVNGLIPEARTLRTDRDEDPDRIEIGPLIMMILQRGENYYLRVWNKEAVALKTFTGYRYFPIKPDYRIIARFLRYDPPRTIRILDAIGTEYDNYFFGEAHFSLHGVDCSLVAEGEMDGDELLFSFKDPTGKDLTYPGGRFLTTPKPENDQIILDFNQALNWPCAYTAFATCPLPPSENHLAVRIEAGEMRYQK